MIAVIPSIISHMNVTSLHEIIAMLLTEYKLYTYSLTPNPPGEKKERMPSEKANVLAARYGDTFTASPNAKLSDINESPDMIHAKEPMDNIFNILSADIGIRRFLNLKICKSTVVIAYPAPNKTAKAINPYVSL